MTLSLREVTDVGYDTCTSAVFHVQFFVPQRISVPNKTGLYQQQKDHLCTN